MKKDTKETTLKKTKSIATGILLIMIVVYIAAKVYERTSPWVGFVRAFAEASMIGALADWFAVVALFRHPLGIPLPHTAIIPANKVRIGESLGEFVQSNFLTQDVIKEKLQSINVTEKVAQWLEIPKNSELIIDEVCLFIPRILDTLDDKDIRKFLANNISAAINSIEFTPSIIGNLLSILTSQNRHQILMDHVFVLARELFDTYKPDLKQKITRECPLWFVLLGGDTAIYNKVVKGMHETIEQFVTNPNHELRRKLDEEILMFVEKLKTTSEFKDKWEKFKEIISHHPTIKYYIDNVWDDIKKIIIRNFTNSESYIRIQLRKNIVSTARGLLQNTTILKKFNGWIEAITIGAITRHGHEISGMIAERIKKWDARTVTQKLELQVGRDLQYIRLNGTIVGGIVGLIIHTLSSFF